MNLQNAQPYRVASHHGLSDTQLWKNLRFMNLAIARSMCAASWRSGQRIPTTPVSTAHKMPVRCASCDLRPVPLSSIMNGASAPAALSGGGEPEVKPEMTLPSFPLAAPGAGPAARV
jgi:hypothetical protein